MKIILFENKSDNYLSGRFENLFAEHTFYLMKIDDQKSTINHQLIVSKIIENEFSDADLIIIPITLGKIYSNFLGLQLGLMIRLSFEYKKICSLPILFLGVEPENDLYKYTYFATILNTSGVEYCDYNLHKIKKHLHICKSLNDEQIKGVIFNQLILPKPLVSLRHSLINEWAIYRLGLSLNCLKSIEKFSKFENLLNDPYYKLLLNQVYYNQTEENQNILQPLLSKYKTDIVKLLIIDDKAKLGWFHVLEILFKNLNAKNTLIEYSNFNMMDDYEKNEIEIIDLISKEKPNIVLLDLRLFKEEEYLNFPDMDDFQKISGFKLLKAIKNYDPSLQVIMFTASQQAWNLKYLINLGVDGYFIKDSPDNYLSPQHYLRTLENFIDDISKLYQRGKTIGWFYQNHTKLKTTLKSLSWNQNIKTRIEEKLDIAFSLLRINRSEFDKQYLYTEYELAFLVYWSCLNEFQMQSIGNYNGEESYVLPGQYELIKDSETRIQYIQPSDGPVRQTEIWKNRFPDGRIMPNINFRQSPHKIDKDGRKHLKNISNIIPAYIYLKYGISKQDIVDNFCMLNEIRNHLDFTHSSEYDIKNYSIELNRDKNRSLQDCQNMFKFIYFLITETELV